MATSKLDSPPLESFEAPWRLGGSRWSVLTLTVKRERICKLRFVFGMMG